MQLTELQIYMQVTMKLSVKYLYTDKLINKLFTEIKCKAKSIYINIILSIATNNNW